MANEPKGPYSIDECRGIAARCWCDKRTETTEMHVGLAEVVAEAIQKAWLAGRASRDRLREALIPFTHADLREILTGNAIGEDSPVFQRNKAMLRIKDFSKAYEALAEDEKEGK